MYRIEWLLAAFLVLGGSRIAPANPPASPATNLVSPNLPPLWHGGLCMVAGRYGQAIVLCDEVLHADPDNRCATAMRGYAHLFKKTESRQAITDFSEVLRLDSENAAIHVARAQAYRQVKDYDRAIADCSEAIRIDPTYGEAYARRADCYWPKRVIEKSIADYSIALRHSPFLTWARCNRAEVYRRCGEPAKALADLNKVLRLEHYNEQALRGRCLVYVFNLPDYDRALADANEVIRLNPKNPNGYVCRSMAYLAKGETKKGLGDSITAMSLKPPSLCFRGSCKPNSLSFGIGFGFGVEPEKPPLEDDSDERIAACTKRLVSDPNNVAAYYERAFSYARKKDFKRALADFDEIIRHDPSDAEASAERGRIHRCLKQDAEAIEDYTVAVQLDPANANYYVSRASIYSTQKKYEKAWHDYNAALRIDPDIPVAHAFRAWMYDKRVDPDQAIAEYSRAVELSPEDADLYQRRAWVFADKGAFVEAIADFRKALKLDPQNRRAHHGLAWYLATCPDAGLRDGKEARKHATTACEATKWQDPRCLDTLAAAYAECGDFTQAVELLEKTLKLAPEKDKRYYRRRLKLYQSHQPYHLSSRAHVSSPSSK